jgi:hypothetical protein
LAHDPEALCSSFSSVVSDLPPKGQNPSDHHRRTQVYLVPFHLSRVVSIFVSAILLADPAHQQHKPDWKPSRQIGPGLSSIYFMDLPFRARSEEVKKSGLDIIGAA